MRRPIKALMIVLRGSALVIALLMLYGAIRASSRFTSGIWPFFRPSVGEPEIDPRTLVVHQVQGVSELTTAVFAMESVVPASRDRTLGNYVIGRTTLLYIAYGEVRAGVDLSDIGEEDVTIVGDRLELRLPPPEILDSKIDVMRSRVYDYDRGFLGLGPDSAPELQETAQRETLVRIVNVACDNGLLNDANERAEVALTRLLDSVGYNELEIQTQPPETEACETAIASMPR
ncbi:MAG: DUF4230 domain-containing protein [Leptolyngbyaceae bacterium]|nr:DUF4230 domain-containing protein [Leptolyngbyaceae bacterium]